MASGWNMEGLTHARRKRPAISPIACRICNDIFMDNKELLNHFAAHQVLVQSAAETRQALLSHMLASHGERPPPPPPPAGPSATANRLCLNPPMVSQNISYGTNSSGPPIGFRGRVTFPGAPQVVVLLDSRDICFTRPFLSQLQAKLLVDGMASIVDYAVSTSDEPEDDKALDLTLRLGIGKEEEQMKD